MSQMRHLMILEDGSKVMIVPYRYSAAEGGYAPLLEKERWSNHDPEALGKAILEAFEDCG